MSRDVAHVVLDRDGVLNREVDDGWVAEVGEWEWEDGALAGLAALAAADVAVSVVTNQSGIGRGVVRAEQVEALHDWLGARLRGAGVRLVGIWVCPHAPDEGCTCRKPAAGAVREAIAASGVPPDRTVLVGDARRDLDAARTAGIAAVLVRTGKGRRTEREGGIDGVAVHDDLADAVRALAVRPASR